MSKIQQSARDGLLGASYKSIANCDQPLCKACLHGKQHKWPIVSSTLKPINSSHLEPGDYISGDQLESTQPGLIPSFKGSPSTSFYHAGTLFVDRVSRLLHFTPHCSTGAKEAIFAKQQFELFGSTFIWQIKQYHADNGIFTSKAFCESCWINHQPIDFCGVDTHHQNGIAECHIRTIIEHARMIIIHAMIQWPEIIHVSSWPYAKQLAIDIHNNTPTS